MHSTNVSSKHLREHTQPKFIVKNEFVATYGYILPCSGFCSRTLNVAQQPSSFSILNTVEVVPFSVLVVGIAHGVPLLPQVYSITGLVLHIVALL